MGWFLTLMERAYRWLSITWLGSGSSVGSHWRGFRMNFIITFHAAGRGLQIEPTWRLYSQRYPCPCWAALAAGEEVRKEDAWACLLTWWRTRPVGKGREASWTSLRKSHQNNESHEVETVETGDQIIPLQTLFKVHKVQRKILDQSITVGWPVEKQLASRRLALEETWRDPAITLRLLLLFVSVLACNWHSFNWCETYASICYDFTVRSHLDS